MVAPGGGGRGVTRPHVGVQLAVLALALHCGGSGGAKLSQFTKQKKPAGSWVAGGGDAGSAAQPPAKATPPPSSGGGGGDGEGRVFAPEKEWSERAARGKAQAAGTSPQALHSLMSEAEGLQRRGELHGAAAAFDRVLAVEPTSPRALANKAKVHYDLQELEHAERMYRKALVSHPVDPSAWLNLGLVQLRRGHHLGDARMHVERSLQLLGAGEEDSALKKRAEAVLAAIAQAEQAEEPQPQPQPPHKDEL